MSADSAASTAPATSTPVAPVPAQAAIAILGSMILLILALTAVLVQTTWVDPASATEAPVVEAEHLADARR